MRRRTTLWLRRPKARNLLDGAILGFFTSNLLTSVQSIFFKRLEAFLICAGVVRGPEFRLGDLQVTPYQPEARARDSRSPRSRFGLVSQRPPIALPLADRVPPALIASMHLANSPDTLAIRRKQARYVLKICIWEIAQIRGHRHWSFLSGWWQYGGYAKYPSL